MNLLRYNYYIEKPTIARPSIFMKIPKPAGIHSNQFAHRTRYDKRSTELPYDNEHRFKVSLEPTHK